MSFGLWLWFEETSPFVTGQKTYIFKWIKDQVSNAGTVDVYFWLTGVDEEICIELSGTLLSCYNVNVYDLTFFQTWENLQFTMIQSKGFLLIKLSVFGLKFNDKIVGTYGDDGNYTYAFGGLNFNGVIKSV